MAVLFAAGSRRLTWLTLTLFFINALLAVQVKREFRTVRLLGLRYERATISQIRPGFIPSDAFTVDGHRIPWDRSQKVRVLFRLHAATLREEVPFWRSVNRLLPKETVRLVGYCDSLPCGETLVSQLSAPLEFDAVTYYSIEFGRLLTSCDSVGDAAVLDQSGRILGRVHLASVEETAARLADLAPTVLRH